RGGIGAGSVPGVRRVEGIPAAVKHLLVFSIGPVQEFIAAARRTRDLWVGSEMLSEVSRAAAGVIGDGRLIFPPSIDPELPPSVANVIQIGRASCRERV